MRLLRGEKAFGFECRLAAHACRRHGLAIDIVRHVARKAGITKRVYPHLLRHTMATKLLALGMDITDVQRFLGHENITTTRHYAETTAATLRWKFDRVTAPAARSLLSGIQHDRGDDAALLAADLLANGRGSNGEVTSADA